jgi:aliphatic nitrilase
VGPIFADQIEVTIRHHALESGCFVVNATGWLSEAQIASVTSDPNLQKALRGGCNTAIVSPEGQHLAQPLREGEGMVIADLDMSLITKRKRMMDSVGHYARPELLSLLWDDRPAIPLHMSHPAPSLSSSGGQSDEAFSGARTAETDADRAVDQRVAVLRGSAR